MKITIAKNAGFCFGVKRATDSLEEKIEYCLNAKGKIDKADDESEIMPVLKGDMRFHLLEEFF